MSTESVIKSISHQKKHGVVYTPRWIVETILDHTDYTTNILDKTIIDPACGEGAFLEVVVERYIIRAIAENYSMTQIISRLETNIIGIDIDPQALIVCARRLDSVAQAHNLSGNIRWRLITADSLDPDIAEPFTGIFDFVVGNPPYIRIQHLGAKRRRRIQQTWHLCKQGSTDIFIAFFELGIRLLKPNGTLGYITPNTLLKTAAAKRLRMFIKHHQLLKTLIDFKYHQIFENATTYSLITILSKRKQQHFTLYRGDDTRNITFVDTIALTNLRDDNWVLAENSILQRIKHIEQRGKPLHQIAKIHVGITTLADRYYIFQNPSFNAETATIVTPEGKTFPIERTILKPIVKASVLKSPEDTQHRYIIFPYEKVNGKHQIISEEKLQIEYPLTYAYFIAIKPILLARDKGKPNPVSWYAFGRSQGLDTSFGKKILTSPMNLKPRFIVWEKPEYTFYAGYCIKFDGDLHALAAVLNSDDMAFYINHISRSYQHNYRSYAKTFLKNFGIDNPYLISDQKQQATLFDSITFPAQ